MTPTNPQTDRLDELEAAREQERAARLEYETLDDPAARAEWLAARKRVKAAEREVNR